MEYRIQNNSELLQSRELEAAQLFEGNGFSIEYFHLLEKNCLHIDQKYDEHDGEDSVLYYLILEGNVEFVFPNQRILLKAQDSIAVDFMHENGSFEIYAKSECRIFYVINTANSLIDNRKKELFRQIDEEEAREPYTKSHNSRVGKYASMMMQIINPYYNSSDLTYAGGYHDIGKIKLDSEILNKAGKLTNVEFERVKQHPIYSYEILEEKLGERIARIARGHHEKLDGSGYPDGLKADEILQESKILAVADIFDALTSQRCYRMKAYSFEEALGIIKKDVDAGKLDFESYQALYQLVENGVIVEGKDNR